MNTAAAHTSAQRHEDMHPILTRRWGWLLALGIVQVLGGAAAIAAPTFAAVVATIAFGWILIVAAVFQLVHAVTVRQWRGFALYLISGLLYGVAGVLLVLNPLMGAVTLTLLIAALLIAEGVLSGVLAFKLRPRDGWGWFLAAAIASIVLGALLLWSWPEISLLALGLLFGLQLVFSGAAHHYCPTRLRLEVIGSCILGRLAVFFCVNDLSGADLLTY